MNFEVFYQNKIQNVYKTINNEYIMIKQAIRSLNPG
jgi:hypothetical protein